ncbi:MAG: hypothetical protein ABI806_11900 [Candidatus Solibacter sp.]
MRYLAIFLTVAAGLAQTDRPKIFTEGTPPKASVSEYPITGHWASLDLGADYLVHSFGTGEQLYMADNYLVVEIALFPEKGESVTVEYGPFQLRINGKKASLLPLAPEFAARNLNRRDPNQGGPLGGISLGGIGIGSGGGGQRGGSPMPGGPDDRRMPSPPRTDDGELKPVVRAEDILVRTALPAGTFKGPVSGFLYFPYAGKASSVKTAELWFHDVALKLK